MKVKTALKGIAGAVVVTTLLLTPTRDYTYAFTALRHVIDPHSPAVTASSVGGRLDDTQYSFNAHTSTGGPVTWNRCAPIHLVVNLTGAPAGARADLDNAVNTIRDASGLDLRLDGTTDAVPTKDWATTKDLATRAWRPVLVAWVAGDSGLLGAASDAGYTTTGTVADHFVSGVVLFNAPIDATYTPGTGKVRSHGALYTHELGHLVGLGHVSSEHELMNPSAQFITGNIAPGDAAGLRLMGSQPCPSPS